MKPDRLLLGAVTLLAGVSVLFGAGMVWSQISRPTPPAQGFYLTDEKPFLPDLGGALLQDDAGEAPITLFTLLDPSTTASAALPDFAPLPNGISLQTITSTLSPAHPQATIREIRLQREYGTLTYTVRFTDGTRYVVDADSGQTLEIAQGEPLSPSARRTQGIRVAVPIAEAIQIAFGCCDGVELELKDARLEEHGGLVIYKVEFVNDVEAFIDASSGTMLFARLTDDEWVTSALHIQPESALQLAQSRYPSQRVRDWKIVPRHGRVVYDVDFGRRMNVLIDAMTGSILQP